MVGGTLSSSQEPPLRRSSASLWFSYTGNSRDPRPRYQPLTTLQPRTQTGGRGIILAHPHRQSPPKAFNMVHGQFGIYSSSLSSGERLLRLFRRVIWRIWIAVLPPTINGPQSRPQAHNSRESNVYRLRCTSYARSAHCPDPQATHAQTG